MKRIVLALVACSSSKQEPPAGSGSPVPPGSATTEQTTTATPNTIFRRGVPTYIVGTTGDDKTDRAIVGQAELVRTLLTPAAKRIADTEVDATKGAAGWPPNPIVYGGAHVNSLVAAIAPQLPFTITAGRLVIGDRTFAGDEYALVTVVPGRSGERGFPEFLLYAGTGTPGIEEINAPTVARADAPIVVADAFGPLVTGTWIGNADGTYRAQFAPPSRRVGWRDSVKEVAGVSVRFRFYEKTAVEADAPAIEAASRGIETVVKKLAPTGKLAMTVVVHPDQRSKAALTGNGGAGHVTAFARTLHVFQSNGLESLVAHEATHAIAPQSWGPAGSPLLGEGVAVWVSGQYGGTPFAAFSKLPPPRGPIRELLGPQFRKLPEGTTYPLAAILVDVAVAKVGLANVRDHLYGATVETWDDACKRAGTTAAALDEAVAAVFVK